MTRSFRSLAIVSLLGLPLLAGCQTYEIGFPRDVQFESEPSGALVSSSLGANCQTPCMMQIGSKQEFAATFSLAGYKSQTVDVKVKVTGAGGAMLAANAVLGGIGGLAAASATGQGNFHVPNPVRVVLEKAGPQPKAAPKSKQKVAPAPAPVEAEPKPVDES